MNDRVNYRAGELPDHLRDALAKAKMDDRHLHLNALLDEGSEAVKEHRFVLRYELAEDDRDVDALVERLGAAGCTDAVVGMGVDGWLALEFTRKAVGGDEEGVQTAKVAIAAVKAALPSMRLDQLRFLPD